MKPQTRATLALLRSRPSVTALEALEAIGSSRLASRVCELREAGYDVRTEWATTRNGARIARYRLVETPEQMAWTA